MVVKNVKGFSLGLIEVHGIKKSGEEYDVFCFNFLIEGEGESRKLFLSKDEEIRKKEFRKLDEWGSVFRFSGEIDGTGRLTIDKIEPNESSDVGLF